jgi:hypothetical protein
MKKSTWLATLGVSILSAGMFAPHRLAAADAPNEQLPPITMPVLAPDLPAGTNRDLTVNRCTLCHSTRLITMQPHFSREAWTAEVKKMRTTFGGPISPEDADSIVDYLMAIRGK